MMPCSGSVVTILCACACACAVVIGCQRQAAPWQNQLEEDRSKQAESFDKGPRIEASKIVGDGEEVLILLLPDPRSDLLDARCLIYKNAKIGAVAVHCPHGFESPNYEADGTADQDCLVSKRPSDQIVF